MLEGPKLVSCGAWFMCSWDSPPKILSSSDVSQQCISSSQTHLKLPNIERIIQFEVAVGSLPWFYTCFSFRLRWYLCLKQVIAFYDASSYMMFSILYEFRITEAWCSSYFCINCKFYNFGVHHQCVKYMFKYLNKVYLFIY